MTTPLRRNQPARLGNYNSNATFKGLIIADVVYKIAGTPTIIGAVVSLSTIDTQTLGPARPRSSTARRP